MHIVLGCSFPVKCRFVYTISANIFGKADGGGLARQRGKCNTCRKSTAQPVTDRFGNSQASLLLFQVYLKQRPRSSGLSADVKVAKLSMIDLAGSEKVRIGN